MERDASSSATLSRRVVWKGAIKVKDGQSDKILQGIVFQSPSPLPLHLSFFPPTPSACTRGPPGLNHITPPIRSTDDQPAILSTPSQHATSSKVTLDTPFGGATGQYETGDVAIDACLRMKGANALELDPDVVPVASQTLRTKAHDVAHGLRVIASTGSSEAVRHIHALLIPPKTKQSQSLDSDGRTLRGVVLRCPTLDAEAAPFPPLLLYGIKDISPKDNRPRLLLFITLYAPNPTASRTGEAAFVDVRASALADLRKRGKAPTATNTRLSAAKPQQIRSESEEERDPAPEPAKKRFKDRSGMGRGALLHHLPPPSRPAAQTKAVDVKGKGRERECSVDGGGRAPTTVKRRKVALDGQGEIAVAQPVAAPPDAIDPPLVQLSIEQTNRNTLRMEVSLALAARGLPPDHHEFKALGGWITRGAGFALREVLTTTVLQVADLSDAIAVHLEAYLPSELKRPKRTTVEMSCQTEPAVTQEMSTQTIEMESEAEPDQSLAEGPATAQTEAVDAMLANGDNQDESVECSPSAPIVVEAVVANLPALPTPSRPVTGRARTRSSAAAAPSQLTAVVIEPADTCARAASNVDSPPKSAKSTADEAETPPTRRSGRKRVPAKSKSFVSSPLKVQQAPSPATTTEVAGVIVTKAVEEGEIEETRPSEIAHTTGTESDSHDADRTPTRRFSAPAKQSLRRTRSGRMSSSVAAPSPTAPAAMVPANPSHSTPVQPASDTAAPPPSSLPSPSLSQTPTKTAFRLTRSNRSALPSATIPERVPSPGTPVISQAAAEATVITPKTTNKRTLTEIDVLEAGEIGPVGSESARRVTRSRRESLPSGPPKEAISSASEATSKTHEVAPVEQAVETVPGAQMSVDIVSATGEEPSLPASPVAIEAAPAPILPVLTETAVVPESTSLPVLEEGEVEDGGMEEGEIDETEEGEIVETDDRMDGDGPVAIPTSGVVLRVTDVSSHQVGIEAAISPCSPARHALSESSSANNLRPALVQQQSDPSPHLLKVFNPISLSSSKENTAPVSSQSLSPSLAMLLNLPSRVEPEVVAPLSTSSPVHQPLILHHPSPIRTSPPALFSLLEEAAERIVSPSASATMMPPPAILLDRPEGPTISRRSSFDITSLLNPSESAFPPSVAGPASSGSVQTKKPLPPLPTQYDAEQDKWIPRQRNQLGGVAEVAALLRSPAASGVQGDLTVVVSGPTPTKAVTIASLVGYSSSPVQGGSDAEQEDLDQQTPKALPMLGLLGVKALAEKTVVASGSAPNTEGVETAQVLAMEDFFVAESPAGKAAALAPGERDPSMYYTSEEEFEPLVKKGWY